MPKIYKVLIDEDTYLGIKAESLLCNKTIKDTLAFMISSNLSPEAIQVLSVLKDRRALATSDGCGTDGKLTPEEKKVEKRGHRDNKRLEEYPDLCGTVDKLLAMDPRPTYAEIGRQVNRSRTTISDYEKRKAQSGKYISE